MSCSTAMKSTKLILLGLCISFAACQSSQNAEHKTDSIASIESGPGKIVDERFLVVPGRSVGEISLGEDVENVGKLLGRPNAGDAAMGKAWGIWYSNDSTGGMRNEIAIYSSYRDTSMRMKDVKQIRITSDKFKTQDGFTTGKSIADTKLKFPAVEKVSTYLNENKDTVLVYDAQKDGIGFEFLKGKSISVTVHPMNKSVNATYLTLHPEWKLIE
ncbi:hypothetical protein EZ449_09565 [Pedobacter frigidisoli]|uniref:Lipoprotein n=1 Tax=Pedobacter frigidisoli TaxID=2530455 RepID=A0A4R0P4D4_9SPHI|nr:hypothetical protein [Pedobacter frigidisoli]TCD10582.1 hypothetical protein EZ449_09565 [Pedobacter frigidisoli]